MKRDVGDLKDRDARSQRGADLEARAPRVAGAQWRCRAAEASRYWEFRGCLGSLNSTGSE